MGDRGANLQHRRNRYKQEFSRSLLAASRHSKASLLDPVVLHSEHKLRLRILHHLHVYSVYTS